MKKEAVRWWIIFAFCILTAIIALLLPANTSNDRRLIDVMSGAAFGLAYVSLGYSLAHTSNKFTKLLKVNTKQVES